MRVIITGQVGVDKGPYLERLAEVARQRGHDMALFHVGQMMYQEAPDVPPGRILNLPISRLGTLRRAVFKEILRQADRYKHVVINTHATFRWRHGLFAAFDFDQTRAFNADLYVTLLDNAESVHQRLMRDHDIDHTLKDIMVWREEEVLATEVLANIARGHGHFYMLSRGRHVPTVETLYRLIFEPQRPRTYLSYPMSHVADQPDILERIERFRSVVQAHFTTFDPGDVDEYRLYLAAEHAQQEGRDTITIDAAEGKVVFRTEEVLQIAGDILGQIYARDFKMIDQSDMIVSYIPELPGGKPALSSGVERELHHAFEAGKEVYVVWCCRAIPSPFITETASRVFRGLDEAMEYLLHRFAGRMGAAVTCVAAGAHQAGGGS